jgi:hypothetical protein
LPSLGYEGIFLETARLEKPVLNIEHVKTERRNRLLGRAAIRGEQRLRNNDALAPVFLLLEGKNFEELEPQIYRDYITDMGERVEKKEFNDYFNFSVIEDEIISDEGVWLRGMLEDGLQAAKDDYAQDPDYSYALARAERQAKHHSMLVDWYNKDMPHNLLIASLCPPESEVPESIAKLSSFKTNRQMASMWLYERTKSGIRMYAFSLDQLTIDRLQDITDKLGADVRISDTTLEQLSAPINLPMADGGEAVEAIRGIHDKRLDDQSTDGVKHYFGIKGNLPEDRDANRMVAGKPEAYELYKVAVQEVAASLGKNTVTVGLDSLATELKQGFAGSVPSVLKIKAGERISKSHARDFMEYLRTRALSEYIFGNNDEHEQVQGGSSSYGGIASAGAYAVNNGISHEGACPTSGAENSAQAQQLGNALQVHKNERRNWIWRKDKCRIDDCPTKPKTVEVGPGEVCHHCQHLFDKGMKASEITRKYRAGRKVGRVVGKAANIFEAVSADLARYRKEIKKKKLVEKQREGLEKQKGLEPKHEFKLFA